MSIGSFNQSDVGEISQMLDECKRGRMLKKFNNALENATRNSEYNAKAPESESHENQSHCDKNTMEDSISHSTTSKFTSKYDKKSVKFADIRKYICKNMLDEMS